MRRTYVEDVNKSYRERQYSDIEFSAMIRNSRSSRTHAKTAAREDQTEGHPTMHLVEFPDGHTAPFTAGTG